MKFVSVAALFLTFSIICTYEANSLGLRQKLLPLELQDEVDAYSPDALDSGGIEAPGTRILIGSDNADGHAKSTQAIGSVIKDEAEKEKEVAEHNIELNREIALEDENVAEAETEKEVEELNGKVAEEEANTRALKELKDDEHKLHRESMETMKAEGETKLAKEEALEEKIENKERKIEEELHNEVEILKSEEENLRDQEEKKEHHKAELKNEELKEEEKIKEQAENTEASSKNDLKGPCTAPILLKKLRKRHKHSS